MLSKRKETLYQGERGCWGGGAGINKSHNSFQSLKTFFSLLSHVRFKHGRRGQDVYFANGVFANCRFYKLPPLFSVYVRYFKKRKKSSPSTLCISFFFFCFFSPSPHSLPCPVLPLPALFCARIVLHVPLGRLRKSRCCWSDSSDLSVNVTATFFKFHSCLEDDFLKIVVSFITMLLTFFFHNEPSLYRAAYLKKTNKNKTKRSFFLCLTLLFYSSAPQGFTYSQCNFLYKYIYI